MHSCLAPWQYAVVSAIYAVAMLVVRGRQMTVIRLFVSLMLSLALAWFVDHRVLSSGCQDNASGVMAVWVIGLVVISKIAICLWETIARRRR